tara:strand:- start:290 stop:493 length:204 start_codon:yes stop_codon:yes gene_type:complete
MIDTDKYEGCLADMKGYDLAILAEELLAEVKRLREALLRIADTANGRPFISGHMDSFVGEVLKELIE